jgi:hypothetical protein
MGIAVAVFFIGVAFIGMRVSRRESVSFWMLLLGLKRGVSYTLSEKIALVFLFAVPLLIVAFAMRVE